MNFHAGDAPPHEGYSPTFDVYGLRVNGKFPRG
jgi:hypothetical protein